MAKIEIQDLIFYLNELTEAESDVMWDLCNYRIPITNNEIINKMNCFVEPKDGDNKIGFLGILNYLLLRSQGCDLETCSDEEFLKCDRILLDRDKNGHIKTYDCNDYKNKKHNGEL